MFGRSNSEDLGVKSVSEIDRNRERSGRRGSPHAHTLGIRSHRLQKAFLKAIVPSRTTFPLENAKILENPKSQEHLFFRIFRALTSGRRHRP